MEEKTAVTALAALAQPMRLRVFRALVGAALSFHLKELMHAALVSHERSGRSLIYRPQLEHMNALLEYLTAHCCQGEPCELGAAPQSASGCASC